jgi:tRNA dimethylallyltransferase
MAAELPLIVVAGPTGAGKSNLAIDLAVRCSGEIVNCDSVQLYRYMDIGSAKTPLAERRGIPHHLIDILDPDEHFTAGDYARAARQVVRRIAGTGRIPIVAGGTGFYLRAFLSGLSESPARDEALRGRLALRESASLHRLLSRFDPAAAKRIHPNDRNKLTRALEICILTRRPATEHFRDRPSRSLEGFRVFKLGLDPPREELSARIDERCRRMFRQGLVDEVRRILAQGYPPDSKALQSIGYREAVMHVQGRLSLDEAIRDTQTATRQYAKRQRTWFRREPDMVWIRSFGGHENSLAEAIHHLQVDIELS